MAATTPAECLVQNPLPASDDDDPSPPTETQSGDSLELKTYAPEISSSFSFFDSIDELKDLSAAIASFQECYEDLRTHLESIKAAILEKFPSEGQTPVPEDAIPTPSCGVQQSDRIDSELEVLCKTMAGRGVRKYLISHLHDLPMLRQQIPKALKLSPNPSKLVLECFGKFFLQGSAAFSKNSSMVPAREASIFVLECFLLMMGMNDGNGKGGVVFNIDNEAKAEAEIAALAWRKRLISEGGVHKASQVDARGLLLLVACFGIPVLFKREDIRDLVKAADSKELWGVLRNSGTFMDKIPEIVDDMIKHKMEVDAVEIIYTFRLEGRFDPQNILLSFLRESKESAKKLKKMGPGPGSSVIESKRKQISGMLAVVQCLGRHNVDVSKVLPGWQITEKIAALEKDIANNAGKKPDRRRAPQKRKSNEVETSTKRPGNQEAKRSRYRPPQNSGIGPINNRINMFDHHGPATSYSASPSMVYGAGEVLPSGSSYSVVTLPTRSYPPAAHPGLLLDPAGHVTSHRAHPHLYNDSVISDVYTGSSHRASSVALSSLYRTPLEGSAHDGTRGLTVDLYAAYGDAERIPHNIAPIPSSNRSSYFYQH